MKAGLLSRNMAHSFPAPVREQGIAVSSSELTAIMKHRKGNRVSKQLALGREKTLPITDKEI